jgi:hypothetical protein
MLLRALRSVLAFLVAPFLPLSSSALLSWAAALPDGPFAWPWAIYVAELSALLVGLPTVSALGRLRLTSARAFVVAGFSASAGSAAMGAIGLFVIDRLGPAYKPMGSGVAAYGPTVLIFMVLAYSACGAMAAAAYWVIARPDQSARI